MSTFKPCVYSSHTQIPRGQKLEIVLRQQKAFSECSDPDFHPPGLFGGQVSSCSGGSESDQAGFVASPGLKVLSPKYN